MLTCLNQHRPAMTEQSKAVLHLRIAMTSIPGTSLVGAEMGSNLRYVNIRCGQLVVRHLGITVCA